jgi:4-hydroxy-tetrahydrodipicolinate synthase
MRCRLGAPPRVAGAGGKIKPIPHGHGCPGAISVFPERIGGGSTPRGRWQPTAARQEWETQMQTPGLIVAPLTPFTPELTVDEAALKRQIDYIVDDCRATMVVAAGVETQEYTYLSFEQRKSLIHRTIEFVDGRIPVMVGISHPSFRTSIELAHDAEKHGAAAVQLLAPLRPFAGAPTQADLIGYFEAIGRETRLPITLYLNPGPGADVSIPDTIALAKLPNVQLIKESSRDLARVSRLIVEIDRAGHARYFTTMQMLLATLQLGGSGATMPPPGSEIARHVIDAFAAGDHERAAELQLQFALFPSKWMHRGLAPAMKAAMNLIGVPAGDPYPPYAPLSREEINALSATLRTTVLAKRLSVSAAA